MDDRSRESPDVKGHGQSNLAAPFCTGNCSQLLRLWISRGETDSPGTPRLACRPVHREGLEPERDASAHPAQPDLPDVFGAEQRESGNRSAEYPPLAILDASSHRGGTS